jgi:toxin-antitoxin system PIN domain toxin
VILVDANLLVYATNARAPEHDRARRWLEDSFERSGRVGLPWQSLSAFVRLVTNPRVLSPPVPVALAWEQVEDWLDHEAVWVPGPTEEHRRVLGGLLLESRAQGNLVTDAQLAALAIEHDLTLCSTDRDFAAFPSLRFKNPLARPPG